MSNIIQTCPVLLSGRSDHFLGAGSSPTVSVPQGWPVRRLANKNEVRGAGT